MILFLLKFKARAHHDIATKSNLHLPHHVLFFVDSIPAINIYQVLQDFKYQYNNQKLLTLAVVVLFCSKVRFPIAMPHSQRTKGRLETMFPYIRAGTRIYLFIFIYLFLFIYLFILYLFIYIEYRIIMHV